MYNGVEIDVLSLGDADCSIITRWNGFVPHRILVDGGCAKDADTIIDFLRNRGYTDLWAAVCTHKHNDHASGLIKIIENPYITIHNGWMHDMRNHIPSDALKRAASADDSVATALETTTKLAQAFANRKVPVQQPFTGATVAGYPHIVVLGPTKAYYETALKKFMGIDAPKPEHNPLSAWIAAASALGGERSNSFPLPTNYLLPKSDDHALGFANIFGGPPKPAHPLAGLLAKSSVEEDPKTQPFNSTSVILGIRHGGCKMLLTADAGSEALAFVPEEWNHLDYLGVPHHGSSGNLSQIDIERFCPKFAFVSAKGDGSHPSPSIVNGLVKVGAKVASTHRSGNVQYSYGSVPARLDYGPVEYLKGNTVPDPRVAAIKALAGIPIR